MKSRLLFISIGVLVLSIGFAAKYPHRFPLVNKLINQSTNRATVESSLEQYGEISRARLKPLFAEANIFYPPKQVVLLGLKEEKTLDIYARNSDAEKWKFVAKMPVLKDSGHIGPKLREGDRQVPEGFYNVESLNPNSSFHLSIRVSYPSAEDLQIAEQEKRENLGGDIMIHGGAASVGCLAMGDDAAQDLFVLTADSGRENVQIVLSPLDFRNGKVPADSTRPEWVSARYEKLRDFIETLPAST